MRDCYLEHCIMDFFIFAETIEQLRFDAEAIFLRSFDIFSLFTIIPVRETIEICADTSYNSELVLPIFLRHFSLATITASDKFSFNNTTYKLTDGVGTRFPLRLALSSIFLECNKKEVFEQTCHVFTLL